MLHFSIGSFALGYAAALLTLVLLWWLTCRWMDTHSAAELYDGVHPERRRPEPPPRRHR